MHVPSKKHRFCSTLYCITELSSNVATCMHKEDMKKDHHHVKTGGVDHNLSAEAFVLGKTQTSESKIWKHAYHTYLSSTDILKQCNLLFSNQSQHFKKHVCMLCLFVASFY